MKLKILLAIIAFFFIILPAAYFGTSEPAFCGSCHYIEGYVSSWSNSPHQEVKCLFCHESRGPFGKVHSKTRGLNYVAQHFTGNYTSAIKGWVDERNCIACHSEGMKPFRDAPLLTEVPNHLDYVQQLATNNTLCIDCHRETGHALNLKIDY